MRLITIPISMLIIMITMSCNGRNNPVVPSIANQPTTTATTNTTYASSNALVGIWNIKVSNGVVEIIPQRGIDMHFNIACRLNTEENKFIEVPYFVSNGIEDQYTMHVKITHPYADLRYTIFDMRGIVMSPVSDVSISGYDLALGLDVVRLVNPDGFTCLFNPMDYPYDDPDVVPLLKYWPSEGTIDTEISTNLNSFMAFNSGYIRRVFPAGTDSLCVMTIQIPNGNTEFGYAIDASWAPIDESITDPILDDFPMEANANEAYKIKINSEPVGTLSNSESNLTAVVYDYRGINNISTVMMECPKIFGTNIITLDYVNTNPDGGMNFIGNFVNTEEAPKGRYPVLVTVVSNTIDSNLGQIGAYYVDYIEVEKKDSGWVKFYNDLYFNSTNDVETYGNSVYLVGTSKLLSFHPIAYSWLINVDAATGELIWGVAWDRDKVLNGFKSYVATKALAVDESGIYIVGEFTIKYTDQGVDFDPGPNENIHYPIGPNINAYLIKFDHFGNFQWAKTWNGNVADIAIDFNQNLYVGGSILDSVQVDLDPGPNEDWHFTIGTEDACLSKFTADGTYQWGTTWGGEGSQIRVTNLTSDVNIDQIYVTGYFSGGQVDINPDPEQNLHFSMLNSAYLSCFASDSLFQWGCSWGTKIITYDITIGNNKLYIVGGFGDISDFDPGAGDNIFTPTGTENDSYLTKFTPAGTYLDTYVWGTSGSDDVAHTVTFHNNYVYVGGTVSYPYAIIDLNPRIDEEDIHSAQGGRMVYVTKFNSLYNDEYAWGRSWGNIPSSSQPETEGITVSSVSASPFGVFVGGLFAGLADFNPDKNDQTEVHAVQKYDAFVLRMLPDGSW